LSQALPAEFLSALPVPVVLPVILPVVLPLVLIIRNKKGRTIRRPFLHSHRPEPGII
jgi:hypothetical protein